MKIWFQQIKYSWRILYFPSQIFVIWIFWGEHYNFSENNIIIVEAAKIVVVGYQFKTSSIMWELHPYIRLCWCAQNIETPFLNLPNKFCERYQFPRYFAHCPCFVQTWATWASLLETSLASKKTSQREPIITTLVTM